MSKVKIFLHAGDYKTATTSIQSILTKNRDDLLTTAQFLYPETALRHNTGTSNNSSLAHHLLYHSLHEYISSDGRRLAFPEYIAKLKAEIAEKQPKVVFISSELFADATLTEKSTFAQFLNEYELEVLYSIRRPDDLVNSMVSQLAKEGKPPKFEVKEVDALRNIEEWEGILGKDHIRVFYFSKQRYDEYLTKIFSAIPLRLTDQQLEISIHDNSSISQLGYRLRRMVFRRMDSFGAEPTRRLLHDINRAIDSFEKKVQPSQKVNFLTATDRVSILKVNADLLSKIATRLDAEDQKLLSAELSQPVSQAPANYLINPPLDDETLELIIKEFSEGRVAKIIEKMRLEYENKDMGSEKLKQGLAATSRKNAHPVVRRFKYLVSMVSKVFSKN